MELTKYEQEMLNGEHGNAKRKSMEILAALGRIFNADKMLPISSVQIAGVSYSNLGEAGLEYLSELAKDGKVETLTTLNPAGMDIENWRALGISEDFAKKQVRVLDAFNKMGIITTCTCTPYFIGNLPHFGEHIAWSESSAVTFANSVIGARSNREGGPSALAAALTGRTPNYGMHLDENRKPDIHFEVTAEIKNLPDYGALGHAIAKNCQAKIPYVTGSLKPSTDELKSLSASIVTYGTKPLYHIQGVTPEAAQYEPPSEKICIGAEDIKASYEELTDPGSEIDFVSIGCPHASLAELAKLAGLLEGKKVKIETWVAVARPIKKVADTHGYSKIIEDSGAKFACDTCMVVAPLKGRFKTCVTTSAKACYYVRGKQEMRPKIGSLEDCVNAAVTGKWKQ